MGVALQSLEKEAFTTQMHAITLYSHGSRMANIVSKMSADYCDSRRLNWFCDPRRLAPPHVGNLEERGERRVQSQTRRRYGFQILFPLASPLGGRGLTRAVEFASKQSVAVPRNSAIKNLRTATSSEKTAIQMLKNPWPVAVRAIWRRKPSL